MAWAVSSGTRWRAGCCHMVHAWGTGVMWEHRALESHGRWWNHMQGRLVVAVWNSVRTQSAQVAHTIRAQGGGDKSVVGATRLRVVRRATSGGPIANRRCVQAARAHNLGAHVVCNRVPWQT